MTTTNFVATSATPLITLRATNPGGGDRTTFVDDVRINSLGVIDTPTLTNPSFESGTLSPFPGYSAVSGWSSNTSSSGVNDAAGPFVNGLPIPDGSRVGFIQQSGTYSQNVVGLNPNKLYTATYLVDERGAAAGTATSTSVSLDGGATTFVQPDDIVRTPQFRRIMSGPLPVSGSSSTLQINAAGVAGDNTLLIDAVSISRAVPLVGDLGFENPVQPGAGFDGFEQANGTGNGTLAGSAWTFVSGGGITNGQSAFGPPQLPEGNQGALLQDVGSSFSQLISGFEQGVTYSLSFAAAGRGGGANDFQVLLDGTPLTFGGASSILPTVGVFNTFTSDEFKTPGGSFVLSFEGLNTLGGDRTSFIDDVRFNFVAERIPEPSTIVLFGMGLVGLAGMKRRRNGR